MRAFTSVIAACLMSASTLCAQDYDTNMFNHMSLGVTAGTPGVGLDIAMPMSDYVQVRAGATYMPQVSFNTELEYNDEAIDPLKASPTTIKSKVDFFNAKLLFDIYFSPSFPLHVTLGAYYGGGTPITIESVGNEEKLTEIWQHNTNRFNDPYGERASELWGPMVGSYVLLPDNEGKINARIEASKFKPYAGLGWGRAQTDGGINWMVEAGVMFWNEPKLYCTTTCKDAENNNKLKEVTYELPSQGTSSSKGGLVTQISKIKIYPVINFRLGFNLF